MKHPMLLFRALLLSLALAALPVPADAQSSPKPLPKDPTADPVLIAAGFLDGHPDLRFRLAGLEAYGKKDHARAFKLFRQAGYYSDKPSQAIVGEMLWIGLGAPQDRALAAIWMELAAERGYASFLEKRDHYLAALTPAEQARMRQQRNPVRAEYGDAVAERRLERVLRRERAKMTGSRVGSLANPVQILVPGHGSIDATRFYDPQFWEPSQYRQWHDDFWMELKMGQVKVGELETVQDGQALPPSATPAGAARPLQDPAPAPPGNTP
jgi:hypothetical protein